MKASPNKKATPKAVKKATPKAAPKAMKVKAMKATPTKRRRDYPSQGGARKAGAPSSYKVVATNLQLSFEWRRKAEEEKEKVDEQLKKALKEKKKLENELEVKKEGWRKGLENVELEAKNELKKTFEKLDDNMNEKFDKIALENKNDLKKLNDKWEGQTVAWSEKELELKAELEKEKCERKEVQKALEFTVAKLEVTEAGKQRKEKQLETTEKAHFNLLQELNLKDGELETERYNRNILVATAVEKRMSGIFSNPMGAAGGSARGLNPKATERS